MSKHIQLQINGPCQEKWESMEALSGAAFCQSCQKIVTDFTKMSDEQIVDYFRHYKGNACGRFYADQVNRIYTVPARKASWLKYVFTVALPAIFLNIKSDAQKLTRQLYHVEALSPKNITRPHVNLKKEVSGTVINEFGKPVPFATVMIPNSVEGTTTDEAGFFSIRVGPGVKDLQISSVGYETKNVTISQLTDSTRLQVSSQPDIKLSPVVVVARLNRIMLGGVSTSYVRRSKIPKLMPERLNTKPDFMIFPNPVSHNGIISIRFNEPVSGDQLIEIFDAEGKRMQESTVHLDHSSTVLSLVLNLASSGVYVVKIRHQHSHKVQSARVLVQ